MAVETADDRLALLADFGVVVIKADTTTFTAIQDAEFSPIDPNSTVAYEGTNPVILCRTSDVSGLVHGSSLSIGGVSYTVQGIEPDGTGFTLLQLEQV